MKKMIFAGLLMLSAICSYGQNKIVVEKDKMTNTYDAYFEKNLKCSVDGKVGFVVKILITVVEDEETSSKAYIGDTLIVTHAGLGACSENDTLYFLFADGERYSITSNGNFSCDGDSYFVQDAFPKELYVLLGTKKLTDIRFTNGTTFKSYTYTLKKEQQSYFINCINLLMNKNNPNKK